MTCSGDCGREPTGVCLEHSGFARSIDELGQKIDKLTAKTDSMQKAAFALLVSLVLSLGGTAVTLLASSCGG